MKETIHDFIVENPDSKIVVDLKPFPVLLAAKNGTQKYVRSQPNSSENDNLLKLPRVLLVYIIYIILSYAKES